MAIRPIGSRYKGIQSRLPRLGHLYVETVLRELDLPLCTLGLADMLQDALHGSLLGDGVLTEELHLHDVSNVEYFLLLHVWRPS